MKYLNFFVNLYLLAYFGNVPTFAKNFGELYGTIYTKHPNKKLFVVSIELSQSDTVRRALWSDIYGNFNADSLPVGKYDLRAISSGYKPIFLKGLSIRAGKSTFKQLVLSRESNEQVGTFKNWALSKTQRSRQHTQTKFIQIVPSPPPPPPPPPPPMCFSIVQNEIEEPVYYLNNTMVGTANIASPTIALNAESLLPEFPATKGKEIGEQVFKETELMPTSTFSIDVDRASYALTRQSIQVAKKLPAPEQIRIEELINYFEYDYPAPQAGHPYDVHAELSDCPWNPKAKLLMLGLQAEKIDLNTIPANNLTFLVDVSGSMMGQMPLVKNSLRLLIDNMRPQDNIALVVYAGAAGLVLPPTSGNHKNVLYEALDKLQAGGSTAGGEGILLAYKTAKEHYQKNGNNRVILCTDGDFNVGVSSETELEKLIEQERQSGIFLTVLGFGMGNYQDKKMEILADKGNGNYSYIDNIGEAKKSLVKEMGSTLLTVAKDVKLQLDFNPQLVAAYRLVGYENRMLANKDFNDDSKDAGEMGAGHTVTAFYEVILTLPLSLAPKAKLVNIKTRYKQPQSDQSVLFDKQILSDVYRPLVKSSENFRFAASVAGFGMCLRESQFIDKSFDLTKALALAKTANQTDSKGYKADFVVLFEEALKLAKNHK